MHIHKKPYWICVNVKKKARFRFAHAGGSFLLQVFNVEFAFTR